MIKYSILMTEPAEYDLKEIVQYYCNEVYEPDIARNIIAEITEGIFNLEMYPFRYPFINEENLAEKAIRRLLVQNYCVFFVIEEELQTVNILRVLHNKRNWLDYL
ncbi:type II toxin-antitoxin system RelE/ParE family toxin [Sutcliffiella sp. NPDC057660]|uniref:type II toxin-antitoxin system RelE/ParE family toxin n=1 Tax=Sutcliffiella sp. NPDC057660 TaxID=3346199 RepID=UPI00368F1C37